MQRCQCGRERLGMNGNSSPFQGRLEVVKHWRVAAQLLHSALSPPSCVILPCLHGTRSINHILEEFALTVVDVRWYRVSRSRTCAKSFRCSSSSAPAMMMSSKRHYTFLDPFNCPRPNGRCRCFAKGYLVIAVKTFVCVDCG